MRQPDIEIYLRDASQQAIADWLESVFGHCSQWRQQGQTFKCQAGDIPVTWLPKAVGKWHCLLLESDRTPWASDLECARAAFERLGVEIRCAPGGWQEDEADEDADRWIAVDEQGEREITWHTG